MPDSTIAEPLDRRLHAFRPDLADARLEGKVEAPKFVTGKPAQLDAPQAAVRKAADGDSEQEAELLYGDRVLVFEEKAGWAWIQGQRDGYVGYVESKLLSDQLWDPTHRVAALRTPLFAGPGLKTAIRAHLHMESAVRVEGQQDKYVETRDGWIYTPHLTALDQTEPDYVATALKFLGAPYVWGGRSSLGLDCSGLVQIALQRAGLPCPRDSDMQAKSDLLGEQLVVTSAPERGDLIYWKGHVAIALNTTEVVNATASGMAVIVEPLAAINARAVAESGQGIIAIRRPAVAARLSRAS